LSLMRRESEERRSERLRVAIDFQESGLNARAYGLARGIPYWKVLSFLKRTESEQRMGGGFTEVPLMPVSSSEYVVKLRSGRSLTIPAVFQEQRVERLIRVLERC
jgi:hypothetical protein